MSDIVAFVGLFFVTPHPERGWPDGQWQGQVMNIVGPSHALVQLHSWAHGGPTNLQLVSLDTMWDWHFYDNEDDWIEAGAKVLACQREVATWLTHSTVQS